MTLTRRDRAALLLAYECCRSFRDAWDDADGALGMATNILESYGADFTSSIASAVDRAYSYGDDVRHLRARLALLLRALLSPESAIYRTLHEPATCTPFTHANQTTHVTAAREYRVARRFSALWENAPRHAP